MRLAYFACSATVLIYFDDDSSHANSSYMLVPLVKMEARDIVGRLGSCLHWQAEAHLRRIKHAIWSSHEDFRDSRYGRCGRTGY